MLSWLNSMKEKWHSPHPPRVCITLKVLFPSEMLQRCFEPSSKWFFFASLVTFSSPENLSFCKWLLTKAVLQAGKGRVEGNLWYTEEAAELSEKMASHPLSPSDKWDAGLGDEPPLSPSNGPFWGSICLSSTWGSRAPASSSSCISCHVIPYPIPNTCLPRALELHKGKHMGLGAENSPGFEDTALPQALGGFVMRLVRMSSCYISSCWAQIWKVGETKNNLAPLLKLSSTSTAKGVWVQLLHQCYTEYLYTQNKLQGVAQEFQSHHRPYVSNKLQQIRKWLLLFLPPPCLLEKDSPPTSSVRMSSRLWGFLLFWAPPLVNVVLSPDLCYS